MKWLQPLITRVASFADVDRVLRNLNDRIKQLTKAHDERKHSSLKELGADDHSQYLLADGSRDLSGNLTVTGNGSVGGDLDVTGDISYSDDSHGDKVLVLSMGSGIYMDSSGGYITGEVTSGFDWYGRLQADAAGNIGSIPFPLHVGDRIKSLTFRWFGYGTATRRFSLCSVTVGGGAHTVNETTTTTASGHLATTLTVSPNITISAGSSVYWAQMRTGAALDRFYTVEITYDRP